MVSMNFQKIIDIIFSFSKKKNRKRPKKLFFSGSDPENKKINNSLELAVIHFVAFNRLFCNQHENIEEIMDTFNVIELRLCEYRMHSSFISITFMSEYRLRFIRKSSIIKHIYRPQFKNTHLSLPQPYFILSKSFYCKCVLIWSQKVP